MNVMWLIFVIALGACVGSFLNVVIYRLPRGESIVFPGSHCPSCGHAIDWFDNIPLVSWFALRGKCRRCKAPISPRYVIIEAATALRVAGLFACYYMLRLRTGAGEFEDSWPMFVAHAGLLCGLLACSVVDLEQFQIPLEVMWVCAIAGLLAAAAKPHPFLAMVSPTTIAVGAAAAVGLVISLVLLSRGYLQPSFLDAQEPPPAPPKKDGKAQAKPGQQKGKGDTSASSQRKANAAPTLAASALIQIPLGTVTAALFAYVPGARPTAEESRNVALTKEHGVNPRKEVLWEVAFLLPPLALAGAMALLMGHVPAVRLWWDRLLSEKANPLLAPHLVGLGSALFGYLIGGLWVWATRILGTLAFNKEAMGMGDVHILAAVGAVCGWIVPSLTFFVAPFIGLGWALYQWIGRRQGVVAYGPLLATATFGVMVFYDPIVRRVGLLLTGGL
jgi:leader peptidase (prepilin peptidase)/N-methyltransferase